MIFVPVSALIKQSSDGLYTYSGLFCLFVTLKQLKVTVRIVWYRYWWMTLFGLVSERVKENNCVIVYMV